MTNARCTVSSSSRSRLLAIFAVGAVLVGAWATSSASGSERATGTLDLQGSLATVSRDAPCPDGVPLTTACHSRTAEGDIPGLGRIGHTYLYNGDFTRCGPADVVILGYATSLRVVGKGEISVSVADAACLLADLDALNATGSFTVTGGPGIYAGASGSGRIERAASFSPGEASGPTRGSGRSSLLGSSST
jgi:hypothetical protein